MWCLAIKLSLRSPPPSWPKEIKETDGFLECLVATELPAHRCSGCQVRKDSSCPPLCILGQCCMPMLSCFHAHNHPQLPLKGLAAKMLEKCCSHLTAMNSGMDSLRGCWSLHTAATRWGRAGVRNHVPWLHSCLAPRPCFPP